MKRLYKALLNSLDGVVACYKNEVAFRQELWVFVISILVVIWLPAGFIEKILLIASIVLIIIVELINTAVEAVVDRISEKYHSLSKIAKDAASAAVLLAILLSLSIWASVLYHIYLA